MPRLVVSMDQFERGRLQTQGGPRATVGANVHRPFYRTPAYLGFLALLTLAAAGSVGLGVWRLFAFPH